MTMLMLIGLINKKVSKQSNIDLINAIDVVRNKFDDGKIIKKDKTSNSCVRIIDKTSRIVAGVKEN